VISARIDVGRRFGDEIRRRSNDVVREAIAHASQAGAEKASEGASRRRRTGTMAEMEVLEVEGTGTGWAGGFRSAAFYAGFQSRGTSKGIAGLGFLEEGAKVAKRELIAEIERRLGSGRR
jgi:hypothetical protein